MARPPLDRNQPPIQMVSAELSQGIKLTEREADHSSPSSIEFGVNTSTPPHDLILCTKVTLLLTLLSLLCVCVFVCVYVWTN
jgi:hypothetical protein